MPPPARVALVAYFSLVGCFGQEPPNDSTPPRARESWPKEGARERQREAHRRAIPHAGLPQLDLEAMRRAFMAATSGAPATLAFGHSVEIPPRAVVLSRETLNREITAKAAEAAWNEMKLSAAKKAELRKMFAKEHAKELEIIERAYDWPNPARSPDDLPEIMKQIAKFDAALQRELGPRRYVEFSRIQRELRSQMVQDRH